MARRAILAAFLTLTLAPAAVAGPGDLDASWGSGGVIYPDIGGSQGMALSGVSVFDDGRVVIVGDASMDGPPPSDLDFAIFRRNFDGTPDTTFGTNGRAILPFNLVANGNDTAMAAAQGPGGTIYVVGFAQASPSGFDIAVARLTSTGGLDSTFGTGGKVTINVGTNDSAHGLAVLPDGGLILAAEANLTATLIRLDSAGDPVLAFGGDGSVETAVGGAGADTWNRVILTGDKIVAGGTSNGVCVMLGRFNLSDGTLDSTFAGGGFFFTAAPSGTTEQMSDLTKAGNGTLILSGSRVNPSAGSVQSFARSYSADGGFIRLINGPPNSIGSGVVAQNNRLILTGSVNTGPPTFVDFFAQRTNLDGTPDLGFGSGGTAVRPIGPADADDFLNGTAIQGDRLILVGNTDNGTTDLPVVAAVKTVCRADLAVTNFELLRDDGRPPYFGTFVEGYEHLARVTVKNNGVDTVSGSVTFFVGDENKSVLLRLTGALPKPLASGESATVEFRFDAELEFKVYWAIVEIQDGCEDPTSANNSSQDLSVRTLSQIHSRLERISPRISRGLLGLFGANSTPTPTQRPAGSLVREANDITRIHLAVVRLQGNVKAALRVRPACYWLKNARAGFVRMKPVNGKCSKPVWLPMRKVRGKWVFRLLRGLPPGKYVAFTRSTNRAGYLEDEFVAGRNRRAFTVRKRI